MEEELAPAQELGCEAENYGVLDASCGGCLCGACAVFMSDCDDDCWRLLGCLITACDHDPNDPHCAASLCTSFIGSAPMLQGFSDCSMDCKDSCDSGP